MTLLSAARDWCILCDDTYSLHTVHTVQKNKIIKVIKLIKDICCTLKPQNTMTFIHMILTTTVCFIMRQMAIGCR